MVIHLYLLADIKIIRRGGGDIYKKPRSLKMDSCTCSMWNPIRFSHQKQQKHKLLRYCITIHGIDFKRHPQKPNGVWNSMWNRLIPSKTLLSPKTIVFEGISRFHIEFHTPFGFQTRGLKNNSIYRNNQLTSYNIMGYSRARPPGPTRAFWKNKWPCVVQHHVWLPLKLTHNTLGELIGMFSRTSFWFLIFWFNKTNKKLVHF
jgi:hypothetical protein